MFFLLSFCIFQTFQNNKLFLIQKKEEKNNVFKLLFKDTSPPTHIFEAFSF